MTQSTVSAGSNPLSHRGLLTIWAALHRVVGHGIDLVHLQVSVYKLTSFLFVYYMLLFGVSSPVLLTSGQCLTA